MIFLRALTPIHAGTGRGGEIIDLPVQRDEFGFPCIWASSLKGAIRSAFSRPASKDEGCIRLAFGSEPLGDIEYSSHVSFLDARLLLVPMRSLRGVWVYATSPHLIGYLRLYLETVGNNFACNLKNIEANISSTGNIFVNGRNALLNEEWVELKEAPQLIDDILAPILPHRLLENVRERGLVVLDDDLMKNLLGRSMFIQYRVRLSRETKTVEEGPWSEEYLPEETVLVSAIIGRNPHSKVLERARCKLGSTNICNWMLERMFNDLGGKLWVGGKETLGRGFLEVHAVQGG